MPYFQLENIYWEYQINTARTFKIYLDSANKFKLILPVSNGSAYKNETFMQAISNAKATNAEYFIIGKMKALKEVMIISIAMYNTSDSNIVWRDSLLARTSYDLNPILKLFAEDIGTEHKPSIENKNYSKTYFYPKELT